MPSAYIQDVPIMQHLENFGTAPVEGVESLPESKDSKAVLDTKDVGDGKTVLSGSGKELLYLGRDYNSRWEVFTAAAAAFTSRGIDFETAAVIFGADYRVTEHFVLGAAVGYAHTWADFDAGGSVDINSALTSIFGRYSIGGFYVEGIVDFNHHWYDTHRAATGGFANGETDGMSVSAGIGGGYDFRHGPFTIGVFGSLRYTDVWIDGFHEHGSVVPLQICSGDLDAFRTTLGVRAAHSWNVGRAIVTPQVRVEWLHEFLDTTDDITSRNLYVARPRDLGKDAVLVTAGPTVQVSPRVALFAYYFGEFGRRNYSTNGVGGGVSVSF